MKSDWNRLEVSIRLCAILHAGLFVVSSFGAGAQDTVRKSAESSGPDELWWSLRPLSHTEPPSPEGIPEDWTHHQIDRFVFEKLALQGLRPNPPAERRALIRRVSYDLTGLPPTPEAVAAFVRDPEPRTYERLVERLLASPHYGERWGRHWLDVVRFGESRGFERNEIIPNAWPFRDYVIRSFNEDKPFNEFIVEHLAGDVIGKGKPDVEVGSAFLTIGPYDDVGNQDAVAALNIRAATVDDMVTATSAAFLGLTVNCARCHDHKFDPIPTEDYYRLKSAFDGVSHGPRVIGSVHEREAFELAMNPLKERKSELVEAKKNLEKGIIDRASAAAPAPESMRAPPSAQFTEERFRPVQAGLVRFTVRAHSGNPSSGVGARLDEFEVWTGDPVPRNVALASAGATVVGAAGNVAKDFEGAYSVDLVNDGKYGARWFVGNPPVLTVSLARAESIARVAFSFDRATKSDAPIEGLGPMVAEYEIDVSIDGEHWSRVADSYDRKPISKALERERYLRAASEEERAKLNDVDSRMAAVDREIRAVPSLATVWAGQFTQPKEPTKVFRGGDPMKAESVVKPASLDVLGKTMPSYQLAADASESERRLALAKWIASDENPLTARVAVNRVWQHHFGTGIVETPSDFGSLGGRPSHPELLDWLARRLQSLGWSLKALHREILLSQTYRQSSHYRREAADMDSDARLLWRFPPRRMSAEEVRDTILFVAGKLDRGEGGPGFKLYEYKQDNVATYVPLDRPGPETYRRSVYHQNARASVVDILSDFDLPDNAFAAPKRAATTTPLQTLTMLNHRFVLDMARALSDRISFDQAGDLDEQVRRAYRLAFQRDPDEMETAASAALIRSHGSAAFCRALLNANELIYLE
ncbi:MAG: DUF1553 domain-containing protein [Verrucomicrobia bacterium]|nr:DUF1553 domain-containing protein [Verrucomicrobiota bacterium]